MLDLSVIILTKDERLHIKRCLENVNQFAKNVYVIDCHSTDGTQEIARSLGAEVIEHDWPGNQAAQFNWAIDNIQIDTEWILRLDADEYLTDDLINEITDLLRTISKDVSALVFPLGRAFMGRVLRHGIVNGISMVRMFRNGCARYENRQMDEHLLITNGTIYTCHHKFIDDNMMPLSFFIAKHNNYSAREASLLIAEELDLTENDKYSGLASPIKNKRKQKDWYGRLPLFWRAGAYFFYRYFLKLGFLDGKEGFLWDFLQGWWYRTLVDAKIYEIKKKCGNNPQKIKELLHTEYGIQF